MAQPPVLPTHDPADFSFTPEESQEVIKLLEELPVMKAVLKASDNVYIVFLTEDNPRKSKNNGRMIVITKLIFHGGSWVHYNDKKYFLRTMMIGLDFKNKLGISYLHNRMTLSSEYPGSLRLERNNDSILPWDVLIPQISDSLHLSILTQPEAYLEKINDNDRMDYESKYKIQLLAELINYPVYIYQASGASSDLVLGNLRCQLKCSTRQERKQGKDGKTKGDSYHTGFIRKLDGEKHQPYRAGENKLYIVFFIHPSDKEKSDKIRFRCIILTEEMAIRLGLIQTDLDEEKDVNGDIRIFPFSDKPSENNKWSTVSSLWWDIEYGWLYEGKTGNPEQDFATFLEMYTTKIDSHPEPKKVFELFKATDMEEKKTAVTKLSNIINEHLHVRCHHKWNRNTVAVFNFDDPTTPKTKTSETNPPNLTPETNPPNLPETNPPNLTPETNPPKLPETNPPNLTSEPKLPKPIILKINILIRFLNVIIGKVSDRDTTLSKNVHWELIDFNFLFIINRIIKDGLDVTDPKGPYDKYFAISKGDLMKYNSNKTLLIYRPEENFNHWSSDPKYWFNLSQPLVNFYGFEYFYTVERMKNTKING